MNYLSLCRAVRRECGITGSGPTTVINQIGMLEKVVAWVNLAYQDIQRDRRDWLFRYGEESFDTQADNDTYLVEMADVATLNKQSVKSYLKAGSKAAEGFLQFREFPVFRDAFGLGLPKTDKPSYFTQRPDGSMMFYPIPDDTYTISFNYYRTVHALAANDDVPLIPDEYQDAIIWKACLYYAEHEEAQAFWQTSNNTLKAAMNRLNANQREQLSIGTGGLGG